MSLRNEESKGPSKAKKSFVFFHGGKSQTVKFYPGTSEEQILQLAKQSLDIPHYDKVTVADENNDPVVFDAKIIPNETKLFLGVNGGDYQPVIEKFV